MMRIQGFWQPTLVGICCAALLFTVRVQRTAAKVPSADSYVLAPDIYPGDPIGKVKKILGAEPGMRQERKDLRYYQW